MFNEIIIKTGGVCYEHRYTGARIWIQQPNWEKIKTNLTSSLGSFYNANLKSLKKMIPFGTVGDIQLRFDGYGANPLLYLVCGSFSVKLDQYLFSFTYDSYAWGDVGYYVKSSSPNYELVSTLTSNNQGFGNIDAQGFSILIGSERMSYDDGLATIDIPNLDGASSKTSWYKAHLLDQKQNTIIQGKYLEFTNKANANDISKVAIVGGGILASGFKGATSTVDSFRVLTNAKLKPGTYKEALDSALGIKNSMGTYNMFNNVNGYKYVGMFKVIPDAVKVEELKNVGDATTGTIASAGGYVLATGKKALMEALGFIFNSQAGLWMMRTSLFLTMSQSTGEIAVTGAEGQILYERTSTVDVTGMNDPALEKQSDYWDAVNDYYNDQKQDEVDNGTTTEDDETPEEETEMSELEENQLTNEKLKTALLQTANDYLSQVKGMLDFNYDNIPKKQDILDQGHEEATTEVEGKKQAQRNLTAWTDWHSQTNGAHTDVQGNELSHKVGLAGLLAGVLPGVLNEYFTRVTGKNLGDTKVLEELNERIDGLIVDIFKLHNIKQEDLPPLSDDLGDFDKDSLTWYYSKEGIKKESVEVVKDEVV